MAGEDVNVMLGRLDERFKNIVQTLQGLRGEIVTKDDLRAVADRVGKLEQGSQTKEAGSAIAARLSKIEDFQTWATRAVVGGVISAVLAGGYLVSQGVG